LAAHTGVENPISIANAKPSTARCEIFMIFLSK
jgi:hypothetical protein